MPAIRSQATMRSSSRAGSSRTTTTAMSGRSARVWAQFRFALWPIACVNGDRNCVLATALLRVREVSERAVWWSVNWANINPGGVPIKFRSGQSLIVSTPSTAETIPGAGTTWRRMTETSAASRRVIATLKIDTLLYLWSFFTVLSSLANDWMFLQNNTRQCLLYGFTSGQSGIILNWRDKRAPSCRLEGHECLQAACSQPGYAVLSTRCAFGITFLQSWFIMKTQKSAKHETCDGSSAGEGGGLELIHCSKRNYSRTQIIRANRKL
jgi:hypothetical protein